MRFDHYSNSFLRRQVAAQSNRKKLTAVIEEPSDITQILGGGGNSSVNYEGRKEEDVPGAQQHQNIISAVAWQNSRFSGSTAEDLESRLSDASRHSAVNYFDEEHRHQATATTAPVVLPQQHLKDQLFAIRRRRSGIFDALAKQTPAPTAAMQKSSTITTTSTSSSEKMVTVLQPNNNNKNFVGNATYSCEATTTLRRGNVTTSGTASISIPVGGVVSIGNSVHRLNSISEDGFSASEDVSCQSETLVVDDEISSRLCENQNASSSSEQQHVCPTQNNDGADDDEQDAPHKSDNLNAEEETHYCSQELPSSSEDDHTTQRSVEEPHPEPARDNKGGHHSSPTMLGMTVPTSPVCRSPLISPRVTPVASAAVATENNGGQMVGLVSSTPVVPPRGSMAEGYSPSFGPSVRQSARDSVFVNSRLFQDALQHKETRTRMQESIISVFIERWKVLLQSVQDNNSVENDCNAQVVDMHTFIQDPDLYYILFSNKKHIENSIDHPLRGKFVIVAVDDGVDDIMSLRETHLILGRELVTIGLEQNKKLSIVNLAMKGQSKREAGFSLARHFLMGAEMESFFDDE